jgi:class 3 adenylate cyclase
MLGAKQADLGEFRLFLEEICCDLCRYRHVDRDGLSPEQVTTTREVRLGQPDAFADIVVQAGAQAPYFVEIKWHLPKEQFLARLARKYAHNPNAKCGKLIIVTDLAEEREWPEIQENLRRAICPTLEIEIWDEPQMLDQFERYLNVEVSKVSRENYREIRDAVMDAEWRRAFGGRESDQLTPTLLWHFHASRLRQLHEKFGLEPDQILRADTYRNLIIVMADLCSFSSYVRDTPDEGIVRASLTAFYSQTRQAVLDCGGMMDKFVGDEVIGLFGFPQRGDRDAEDALSCARRFVDIGNSVAKHWQDRLDRVQKSGGVHVGIGMGDLNLMPLQAMSRSHFGFIGDAINLTARLMTVAGPSEIAVSNSFYHVLTANSRVPFEELEPVEAKNMGLVKCWRWRPLASM